jgi:hypothetical protein
VQLVCGLFREDFSVYCSDTLTLNAENVRTELRFCGGADTVLYSELMEEPLSPLLTAVRRRYTSATASPYRLKS